MVEYLIVGSGFTAATLCYHLVDAGIQPNSINIVGPTKLGYGNAFNCMNDNYRLNVRSEIMWIDPNNKLCLLYTSPSPRDVKRSRMPSSA